MLEARWGRDEGGGCEVRRRGGKVRTEEAVEKERQVRAERVVKEEEKEDEEGEARDS